MKKSSEAEQPSSMEAVTLNVPPKGYVHSGPVHPRDHS